MAISVISIVAMVGMFLFMINKAKLASTRRMALLPLCCAGMELLAAGLLTPKLFPLLTLILVAMRIAILLCCAGAVRQDSIIASRRNRRRRIANITPADGYAAGRKISERCA